MRAIRRRLTYSNVVSTACLFLLLGGVTWAAVGTGGPPIHSCYSKRTGALRIATRCKRSERTLTWNKFGAQGPSGRNGAKGSNGANGLPGAVGATGPAGPSDVYADGTAFGPLTASFVSFGSTTVPAGSYLLEGKAVFFSTENGSDMRCHLAADASDNPEWDGSDAAAETGSAQGLSLSAVATFATNQTVSIICRVQKGAGTIDDARVIAIKTGSLHGSTPRD
jgi:hypothetical protein